MERQYHLHGRPWLPLLSELPGKVQALETSSWALAAAALGRVHNSQPLIRESLRLYSQALRELQHALWDKSLMLEDGTLAACMALSLYEVIECPSNSVKGYDSHRKGLISLIHVRGVDAHTSDTGHRLFLGVRLPGVGLSHHFISEQDLQKLLIGLFHLLTSRKDPIRNGASNPKLLVRPHMDERSLGKDRQDAP